ncbi:enoyl-ACP reductase FabI [Taibaiella chishuiensis]|uniref:Enoyl-[acyl-carrier-protein] reductase [NADH] n=1 Tax=Taibaiella chishuiensis TaxID=1434707 RepID=A0A2P8D2P8_9BACT|nr:SDR family oxidoreductase [Taibaiella chishuiensis]PSK91497.1 enoyl-[acyl-carrier-protein] reductase [NADH] [Taibaiella chishuiensis]
MSKAKSGQLLKGKTGIILGALNEQSLAWHIALQCKQEGARILLSNNRVALRLGWIHELAALTAAPVVCTDMADMAQVEQLIDDAMEHFGGKIDFILHGAAMSYNIRKQNPYTDLDHILQQKTMNVSALSLHKLLQAAFQKNAINEWGSVVALTFAAAQRVFPGYNEMGDAKALLESIARSFGYYYGKTHKVRINTISQSPVKTIAGDVIDNFDRFFHYTDQVSPLGNAPAAALAKFCVTLFSDYTRYLTMQNIFHDGGFSMTGISDDIEALNTIK